jgi:hypothetical protein
MQTQNKPINGSRVFFSIVYLAIAVSIVLFRRDEIFYLEPRSTSYQFDRFLWCLSASFFGFSVLAVRLRHNPKSPFPEYITYYPAMLVAQSALVFSVTHFFTASSGFTFYYLSFAVCFILAVTVDNFWNLINSVVSRGGNWLLDLTNRWSQRPPIEWAPARLQRHPAVAYLFLVRWQPRPL